MVASQTTHRRCGFVGRTQEFSFQNHRYVLLSCLALAVTKLTACMGTSNSMSTCWKTPNIPLIVWDEWDIRFLKLSPEEFDIASNLSNSGAILSSLETIHIHVPQFSVPPTWSDGEGQRKFKMKYFLLTSCDS